MEGFKRSTGGDKTHNRNFDGTLGGKVKIFVNELDGTSFAMTAFNKTFCLEGG